jgi:hypothetical protein
VVARAAARDERLSVLRMLCVVAGAELQGGGRVGAGAGAGVGAGARTSR